MLRQVLWGLIFGVSIFALLFWVVAISFGASIFWGLFIFYFIVGEYFVDELSDKASKNFCYINRVLAGVVMIASAYVIVSGWFDWYISPTFDIFSGRTFFAGLVIVVISYIGNWMVEVRYLPDSFSADY